jgi:hypothetical protein
VNEAEVDVLIDQPPSEGCSVATLNGSYGLVMKGEVLQVGPIVAVGVSTFDGAGHFAADQTVNGFMRLM